MHFIRKFVRKEQVVCRCHVYALCLTKCENDQARHLLYRNFLFKAGDETSEASPGELLDRDVSKVDNVLSSLGNDEASHLGNSAVVAQGWWK